MHYEPSITLKNPSSNTNRLRLYRSHFGYTQEQIADILGCSEKQMSRFESGARIPDVRMAFDLSLIYGEEAQKLFPLLYRKSRKRLEPLGVLRDMPSPGRIVALDPSNKGLGVAVLNGETHEHSTMHHVSGLSVRDWVREKARPLMETTLRRYQPAVLVLPLSKGQRSRHIEVDPILWTGFRHS